MEFVTEYAQGVDVSGVVSRMFVYPVKSCAGVEVSRALLTPTGLEWDRSYMVVDDQGIFRTQRECPDMARICPRWDGDGWVLCAPGLADLALQACPEGPAVPVRVWQDEVMGLDMGPQAAAWLTQCLGVPSRLVRFAPGQQRPSDLRWTGGIQALNAFADGFALLVLSEASLDDLNARLQQAGYAAVGMERFRPNLVISGVEAFDEDRLDRLEIRTESVADAVVLQLVKPCARCSIPDIDPVTARSTPVVSDVLRRFRQDRRLQGAVTFGMNAIVLAGAGQTLEVGQALGANLQFQD